MGGGEMSLANYTFTCTDAHWCPWGFEYDSRSSTCRAREAACYYEDSVTYPTYCNSIWGVDDNDVWEADSGCVRSDPEGIVSKEACVYTGTFGGVDYFFYQDILVDQ
jgi:hypothetical protein